MKIYFVLPNILILVSILIYFIFDYFDGRQVKDERYEFIRLKSFEFVQKTTLFALLALAITYLFIPFISGKLVIMILILASLYGEIGAKLYLRRKY